MRVWPRVFSQTEPQFEVFAAGAVCTGVPGEAAAPPQQSGPARHGAKTQAAGLRFEAGLRLVVQMAAAGLRRARQMRAKHTSARRMRVVETVALGEKRFAAVLQVDGAHFLVGGGAGNVSLLAVLPAASPAGSVPSGTAKFESAEFEAVLQQAASAPLAEHTL